MIYLDNNATTFLDPCVLEELQLFLKRPLGNPSSIHFHGQKARGLLASLLHETAQFFGCKANEVIFTSGATEALNMAIKSAPHKSHIITSSLEHSAVLEPLKQTGCLITSLDPLPGLGAIEASQVEAALRSDTSMIVLMAANNETGIKTDIEAIAKIAQAHNLLFVVDGVALLGKEPISWPSGVSSLCFSGHKIHAPQGIGLAILKKSPKWRPLLTGGPQQYGMRGGTENLFGIVGMTKALTLLKNCEVQASKMAALRSLLEEGIVQNLSDILIHGKNANRVSNVSNMAFLGVDAETLLMKLDLEKVCVSHGSACSSGALEPSRVLLNMGVPQKVARASIRFSLSRFTTQEEILRTIEIVTDTVNTLRKF